MEIEIIIPVYMNYELAYKQIQHYALLLKGEWRLLFCDNTPLPQRQIVNLDDAATMATKCGIELRIYNQIRPSIFWHVYDEVDGIDGERHGSVLNYMVRNHTKTSVIGIQDSDFFWLDPNILFKIEQYFNLGYNCVGAELFYDDFPYVNDMYPQRAGWKTSCVFGMFIDRSYCLDKSFVSSRYEGYTLRKETGHRIRQAIIDDPNMRSLVFPAIKLPDQKDKNSATSWYFLSLDWPTVFVGFHLIQGSGRNVSAYSLMYDELMSMYKNYPSGTYKIIDHHYVEKK